MLSRPTRFLSCRASVLQNSCFPPGGAPYGTWPAASINGRSGKPSVSAPGAARSLPFAPSQSAPVTPISSAHIFGYAATDTARAVRRLRRARTAVTIGVCLARVVSEIPAAANTDFLAGLDLTDVHPTLMALVGLSGGNRLAKAASLAKQVPAPRVRRNSSVERRLPPAESGTVGPVGFFQILRIAVACRRPGRRFLSVARLRI